MKKGKKTALGLGNIAVDSEALDIAGRIAAATETIPSYQLARGEGRSLADPIPYEFELRIKFLESFEQLISIGALFPVATLVYRNKSTLGAHGIPDKRRSLSTLMALGRKTPRSRRELPLSRHPGLADLDVGDCIGAHGVGIALQDRQVRLLARLKRADRILEANVPRGADRDRL